MTGTRKFVTSPRDWYVGVDIPAGRQAHFSTSRGILKHMSTSSFTDSLCSSLDFQSSVSLDSPEPFLASDGEDLGGSDRKQVRVGSPAGGLQDVKMLGESNSPDVDSVTNNQVGNDGLGNPGSATAGKRRPFLKQGHVDSREGELSCTRDTILQKRDADKKHVIGGLSEQRHVELQSHQLYSVASAEQRSSRTTPLQKKPEDNRHSQAPNSIPQPGRNLFEHDYVSAESHSDTKHSSPTISPKPIQKQLGFFRGEENVQLHGSDKENETLLKQKELDDTINPSHSKAHVTMISQVKCQQETRPSVVTQVPKLQSAVPQFNPFNHPMKFRDSDVDVLRKESTSRDTAEGSSLKETATLGTSYVGNPFKQRMALGESDADNPLKETPISTALHDGILLTGLDSDEGNHLKETTVLRDSDTGNPFKEHLAEGSPDVGNPFKDALSIGGSNIVTKLKADEHISIEANAAVSQKEVSTTKTEFSPDVNLLKQDGSYRVNPLLIYKDTKDPSRTGSQISVTPLLTSLPCNTAEQQGNIQVASSEEDRPTNKSEWSREHQQPKADPGIFKASSTSSQSKLSCSPIMSHITNAASPRCDVRSSLDGEKTEVAQISSHRTKSVVILRSKFQPDEGLIHQGIDRTHRRHISVTEDVPLPCQQNQSQAQSEPVPQELTLNPSLLQSPRTKGQDDKASKSSFKTFYPRVGEIHSAMGSTREASLLRSFPIDINPQPKVIEGQEDKISPVPKPRKIPLAEVKQLSSTDPTTSTEITSCPLPLEPQYSAPAKKTRFAEITTQESSPRLARSSIPRDYQHYLGPKEMAHLPPFHQEKVVEEPRGKPSVAAVETSEVYKPQIAPRDFVGNQAVDTTEENPSQIWSLRQTSSNSTEDDSCPIRSALKRLPSRSTSSSASMENLSGIDNSVTTSTHPTEDENARSDPRSNIVITVDNVSEPSSPSPPPPLSLSRSRQMKMSASVPMLQMDEADSDVAFEHLDWRRSTDSSASNLSLSSGMASMSSISSSTLSLYRADYGNLEVQGTIQFALNYIQKIAEFHIFVVQCKDLAVAEPKKSRSDPYVKCYLLPYKTKTGKKKTSVKKKTVNPTYNEILRFKIVLEELKTQNLNVSVWHNDTFGRNAFLGEVELDLSEWDFNNTHINEYTLKPRVSVQPSTPSESFEFDGVAEMRVALRFLPQMSHIKKTSSTETGEVQIWVKDCKNLRPVRDAIIDPFVKCTVLPDMSRKNRQKTRVVKRTSNPMFNHTMVYDGLRPSDLREACMEVAVWDRDKRTNHFIGGIRLGLGTGKSYGVDAVWMDSTQDEADLWQKMMASQGQWVEDVLPLRMFLLARSLPK